MIYFIVCMRHEFATDFQLCENQENGFLKIYIGNQIITFLPKILLIRSTSKVSKHSMTRANLNKSKKVWTSTTTSSKYIPKRPRIWINWSPPFHTSLHKIVKNCFLLSKSCFTMFTFRGTFTKRIWIWKGEF